jgi:hypothetical protein
MAEWTVLNRDPIAIGLNSREVAGFRVSGPIPDVHRVVGFAMGFGSSFGSRKRFAM